MLKQRVITALVLIAFLLPALFASVAWPFALLSLLLIAAAGWEWGRLNGAGQAANFDLYSAQRVEVMRGPFASLHGNSADDYFGYGLGH